MCRWRDSNSQRLSPEDNASASCATPALVAGAGLEPASSAYETELGTISSLPRNRQWEEGSNLRDHGNSVAAYLWLIPLWSPRQDLNPRPSRSKRAMQSRLHHEGESGRPESNRRSLPWQGRVVPAQLRPPDTAGGIRTHNLHRIRVLLGTS